MDSPPLERRSPFAKGHPTRESSVRSVWSRRRYSPWGPPLDFQSQSSRSLHPCQGVLAVRSSTPLVYVGGFLTLGVGLLVSFAFAYLRPEPGILLILAFDVVLAGCFVP